MVFFDTNILIYVHDRRFPHKREIARKLYTSYLHRKAIALSTQVLQEFFVTITRKAEVSLRDARSLVSDLADLYVVNVDTRHILAAIDLQTRYKISFWDGLIIVAAKVAQASLVLSEDLGHMQVYDGIRVENPFVTH
jgi:predicted nucleic acid-binding protein